MGSFLTCRLSSDSPTRLPGPSETYRPVDVASSRLAEDVHALGAMSPGARNDEYAADLAAHGHELLADHNMPYITELSHGPSPSP